MTTHLTLPPVSHFLEESTLTFQELRPELFRPSSTPVQKYSCAHICAKIPLFFLPLAFLHTSQYIRIIPHCSLKIWFLRGQSLREVMKWLLASVSPSAKYRDQTSSYQISSHHECLIILVLFSPLWFQNLNWYYSFYMLSLKFTIIFTCMPRSRNSEKYSFNNTYILLVGRFSN